jgi:hypothetical protein
VTELSEEHVDSAAVVGPYAIQQRWSESDMLLLPETREICYYVATSYLDDRFSTGIKILLRRPSGWTHAMPRWGWLTSNGLSAQVLS